MPERHPFPVCNILGVNIAVTNMEKTVSYLCSHLSELSGSYVCVSNVHTTVTAYEDESYRAVQNGAALALPDGKPLSLTSRKARLCGGGAGDRAGSDGRNLPYLSRARLAPLFLREHGGDACGAEGGSGEDVSGDPDRGHVFAALPAPDRGGGQAGRRENQ